MGAQVGNNKGFVAEINVTPFVDVMLVLLIIFMVTAPMMTEGIDVELPKTQAVSVLPTENDSVVLTIQKDGSVYVGEYKTPVESLVPTLETSVKAQNKQLFLQADKDVPYGIVVDVMGRIKAAGISNMGVVAEMAEDIQPVGGPASGQAGQGVRR